MPRLVILETPFAGKGPNRFVRWISRLRNKLYARVCMFDSIHRDEAPMVSHLLYTQCLNDDIPGERLLGINAGLAWGKCCDATVVYVDRGVSDGMRLGIVRAKAEGRRVEFRALFKTEDEIYIEKQGYE